MSKYLGKMRVPGLRAIVTLPELWGDPEDRGPYRVAAYERNKSMGSGWGVKLRPVRCKHCGRATPEMDHFIDAAWVEVKHDAGRGNG